MTIGTGNLAYSEPRRAERDDVDYRATAALPDGRLASLLVVNISPRGLMARCDEPLEVRDRLRLTMPGIGAVDAEVRWSLGGRLGCEFAEPIDRAAYYELLAALLRGGK